MSRQAVALRDVELRVFSFSFSIKDTNMMCDPFSPLRTTAGFANLLVGKPLWFAVAALVSCAPEQKHVVARGSALPGHGFAPAASGVAPVISASGTFGRARDA
jgi:hypothetical protein